MERSAPPIGIKVICTVWVVIAVLDISSVLYLAYTSAISRRLLLPVGVIAVLAIGYVIVAAGLWKVEPWAWKAGLGLTALGAISAFVQPPVSIPVVTIMLLTAIYLVAKRDLYRPHGQPA